MLLAAILGVVLLAAPASVADASAPPLVVRARGVDEVALADALRPRSGGADVVLLRDAVAVAPDHTFVDIDLSAPDLVITVILADGRVFVRKASAPEGPRDAARLVAAMLAAIAGEALDPLPERRHSPALAPDPPPPDLSQRPSDLSPPPADPVAAATVPEPPAPRPAAPATPPAAPVLEDTHHPLTQPVPEDTRPPAHKPAPKGTRPELHLGLDGAPVIGLGLPAAGVFAGGAGLGLHLLGARRWLVTASLRAAGSERDNFGLLRTRIGVAAGTWLRRGRFDLRLAAGFTVEPWLVTHGGRRVRLGDATPPAPLLGGHLRVTPSFALPGPFRLGLFAELAASAAPSGNAVRISLDDRPLFVLGGLEAAIGLELSLRLDPSRRPRK